MIKSPTCGNCAHADCEIAGTVENCDNWSSTDDDSAIPGASNDCQNKSCDMENRRYYISRK